MSPAERMKGAKCASDVEIEVLADNMQPLQVYLRCQSTMLAGMGGSVITGVSAQEALAACRICRVRAAEWEETCEAVQTLAGMVANIENKKAADRSKSKGKGKG